MSSSANRYGRAEARASERRNAFSFGPLFTSCGHYEMLLRRRVMRVGFRQDDLHFRHRDHWQVANEKEKKRKKNPERADERPDIDPGRVEHSPGGRKEIAVQATDDDDETLEPHAG